MVLGKNTSTSLKIWTCDGRRELSPARCILTSTCVLVCVYPYLNTHTNNKWKKPTLFLDWGEWIDNWRAKSGILSWDSLVKNKLMTAHLPIPTTYTDMRWPVGLSLLRVQEMILWFLFTCENAPHPETTTTPTTVWYFLGTLSWYLCPGTGSPGRAYITSSCIGFRKYRHFTRVRGGGFEWGDHG